MDPALDQLGERLRSFEGRLGVASLNGDQALVRFVRFHVSHGQWCMDCELVGAGGSAPPPPLPPLSPPTPGRRWTLHADPDWWVVGIDVIAIPRLDERYDFRPDAVEAFGRAHGIDRSRLNPSDT